MLTFKYLNNKKKKIVRRRVYFPVILFLIDNRRSCTTFSLQTYYLKNLFTIYHFIFTSSWNMFLYFNVPKKKAKSLISRIWLWAIIFKPHNIIRWKSSHIELYENASMIHVIYLNKLLCSNHIILSLLFLPLIFSEEMEKIYYKKINNKLSIKNSLTFFHLMETKLVAKAG